MGMIMLQALLVSFIGFGLGIGAAAWFGTIATAPGSRLAFYMPWEVFVGTGAGGRRRSACCRAC